MRRTRSERPKTEWIWIPVGSFLSLVLCLGVRAQTSEPPLHGDTSPAASGTSKPTPTRIPGTPQAGQKPDPLVYAPPGSLGDAVRRTKEQKPQGETEKKKSLGVITNESLKKSGSTTASSQGTGKSGKPGSLTPTPFHTVPPPFVERDNDGRTEADWKGLVKDAKGKITRSEERIKQLETEAARLENDFYAWSDGNYRDRVIKPAWDKAREDLKKARTDLDAANLNWENMQEVARKAGAPPGWLR